MRRIGLNASFWIDRPVLITGCSGLTGSWLAARLVESGADVVGLIRDQIPRSQLYRSGTINKMAVVDGDISDYKLLERTMVEYEIDTIFHLAAQTIVSIATRAPLSTFETNIKGTWSLLEAARRNPTVQHILVASTDRVYSDQEALPYVEDMAPLGGHPYDVSKSCADLIARAYAKTYDLPLVITRFTNIYGGGDLNWNRLIPGSLRSVIRGEQPIIRSDGSCKRDYVFVEDVVNGYLIAAEQLQSDSFKGQIFNMGTDKPASVLDVVNNIIAISNQPQLSPLILNEEKKTIDDKYVDSKKARDMLGWNPQHNLRSGLNKTMDWYREFLATA
jgi:CDP-glucose 4,6-dehydratase